MINSWPFFMLFNISFVDQGRQIYYNHSLDWDYKTTHTHITLNRYHRSLIHHWPHGDTVSLVRNIYTPLAERRQGSALNNIDDIILHHYGLLSNIYNERTMLNFSRQCRIIYGLRYSDLALGGVASGGLTLVQVVHLHRAPWSWDFRGASKSEGREVIAPPIPTASQRSLHVADLAVTLLLRKI